MHNAGWGEPSLSRQETHVLSYFNSLFFGVAGEKFSLILCTMEEGLLAWLSIVSNPLYLKPFILSPHSGMTHIGLTQYLLCLGCLTSRPHMHLLLSRTIISVMITNCLSICKGKSWICTRFLSCLFILQLASKSYLVSGLTLSLFIDIGIQVSSGH